MHPTSFFAPYTPPGGNPMSYHLHDPVQAPPYRPGRPYPYIPPQNPSHSISRGPVPHPGPPRPHWPPPFSPPEIASAPAYTASTPPPAYTPHQLKKVDECRCDLPSSDEDDDERPRDRVRQVVMMILIVLNIFVWGLVFWYWIQDDLAGRLWAELRAEGGSMFQI